MKYFAVIDTNVIVSALLSARKEKESNPMKVIAYVFLGKVRLVYNEEILEEYKDVLHRKKFGFDPILVDKVISEIRRIGICSESMEVDDVFPDPDDAVFFEVAMEFKTLEDSTYLVTGNTKHFPAHPIVVTPADFFKIIENSHERSE